MENSEAKEGNIKKEETKKELSKKDIILIFSVILLLSLITYWHFKNWRKSLSEVEMPKFEMPEFEFPSKEEEGYKEFISSDGKLKMKYSADWMEMKSEIFEGFTQEDKGKTLFFAQKFELEKAAQAFLTIQELSLGEEKGFEEIIEKMKRDIEEKEGEMEILKLEIENKTAIFEAGYKGKTGYPLHSKEKIILNKEKTYLISFFTFEKNWPDLQQEAEEIINSTTLLK
ncbi:hypothetical protein KJA14_00015 [Patescibacteria group bacterium]|nr:hypothetical protein [Patescibacteria group bacterium]